MRECRAYSTDYDMGGRGRAWAAEGCSTDTQDVHSLCLDRHTPGARMDSQPQSEL